MDWLGRPKKKGSEIGSGTPHAKPVRVSDYIRPEAVWFIPYGFSKSGVISELIERLSLPDPDAALKAVLERENIGGTIIESKIAIPHARLDGLANISVAIGIRRDKAQPADDIRVFVLFLSPIENTKEHLLFLAAVAALFQNEGLVDDLYRLNAPQEVVDKIREVEKGL